MKLTQNQKDYERLLRMIAACEETLEFVEDIQQEQFLKDRLLQLAVQKSLENIAEGARTMTADFRQRYHDYVWNEMIGMRVHSAHMYWKIDYKVIYKIAQDDVPELLAYLHEIKANME
ncbi:MAG: DUF86 domain-containing protein, partial [Bacteroidota bacterium]